MQLAKLIKSGK